MAPPGFVPSGDPTWATRPAPPGDVSLFAMKLAMNAILRLARPVPATLLAAPLGALVLALALAACSTAEPAPERAGATEPAPELPPGAVALPTDDAPPTPGGFVPDPSLRTQRAGDEGVLVGTDGRGLAELPPEVLADVRAQLLAAGAKDAVAQIDRRYDLGTGRARDVAHAASVVLAGAEVAQ